MTSLPPLVRQGSTGPYVKLLQWYLNQCLAAQPFLVVDGIFGPLTLGMVKRYQRNHALAADGIVGPQTWGAILGKFEEDESSAALKGQLGFPDVLLQARLKYSFANFVARHSGGAKTATQPIGTLFGRPVPQPTKQIGGGPTGPGAPPPVDPLDPGPGFILEDQLPSIVEPYGSLGEYDEDRNILGYIYFPTNISSLDEQDRFELRKLVAFEELAKTEPVHFLLLGNADPRGTPEKNVKLSERRAEQVGIFINSVLPYPNVLTLPVASRFFGTITDEITHLFLRSVTVIGPKLQRPPDRPERNESLCEILAACLYVLLRDKEESEERTRLLCVINKLLAKCSLPSNQIDDLYINGLRSDVRQRAEGISQKLPAPEFARQVLDRFTVNLKNFWPKLHKIPPAENKELRALLRTLDGQIEEGIRFINEKQAGSVQGVDNPGLQQMHDFNTKQLANPDSIVSCYKGLVIKIPTPGDFL